MIGIGIRRAIFSGGIFILSSGQVPILLAQGENLVSAGGQEQTFWDAGHLHLFEVSAESLWLARSRNPELGLVYSDAIGGTEVRNANQFDYGIAPGYRLGLLANLGDYQAEISYFSLESWTAQEHLPGSNWIRAEMQGDGPWAEQPLLELGSDLASAELNLRYPVHARWTLLAGLRYFDFDDSLLVSGGADIGLGVQGFELPYHTQNRLFGGQIGISGRCWEGFGNRLQLTVSGKLGAFVNDVSQESGFFSGDFQLPADGHSQHAAFSGELGLIGSYAFSPHARLQIGYMLLWLDGLALAAEQIRHTDIINGQPGGFAGDGLLMHGASAGLQLSW